MIGAAKRITFLLGVVPAVMLFTLRWIATGETEPDLVAEFARWAGINV